jgi:hypothetical protein
VWLNSIEWIVAGYASVWCVRLLVAYLLLDGTTVGAGSPAATEGAPTA